MTDLFRRDEPAVTAAQPRRWLPVKNGAASEVPAFGLVRVTSSAADGVVTVGQPNADGQQNLFVNGPAPIPVGALGAVSETFPAIAAYDTGDGTPAAAETWGAKSGEWKLRKDYEGFYVLGGAVRGTVNVTRKPPPSTVTFSGARVTHDSGSPQSIPNNSITAVTWATEAHDVGGYFDAGSPTVFTAPQDGYYLLTASLGFASNGTGVRAAWIQATTGQVAAATTLPVTGFATAMSLSGVAFLTAGQTARVDGYQTSGAGLNVDAGTSQFSVSLLGT